jgi:hypothetical protein
MCACLTLWGLSRAAYQHNPQALAHSIGHSNPKALVTTENVFPCTTLQYESLLPIFTPKFYSQAKKEEKPCISKSKMGNLSIKSTMQMRTQVDTTQRKNKSKQSTKIR